MGKGGVGGEGGVGREGGVGEVWVGRVGNAVMQECVYINGWFSC